MPINFTSRTRSATDPGILLALLNPAVGDSIAPSGTADVTAISEAKFPLSDTMVPVPPVESCAPQGPVISPAIMKDKGNGQHLMVLIDKEATLVSAYSGQTTKAGTQTGWQLMRAVYVRGVAESIKEDSPNTISAVRRIWVNSSAPPATPPPDEPPACPLLTLISPMDGQNVKYRHDDVMLDFYLHWVDLIDSYHIDGYRIQVTIMKPDGTQLAPSQLLDQWTPYCINGLPTPPLGTEVTYTIKVALVSATHPYAQVPYDYYDHDYNVITRDFVVKS